MKCHLHFYKISIWTDPQRKLPKEVKDLETELKKIMEEKTDAIRSQNFKMVTMHLCISLLDKQQIVAFLSAIFSML